MVTGKRSIANCLIKGKTYLWLKRVPGKKSEFLEVVFVDYKPHPGEVLVICRGKIKSICRRDLFTSNGLVPG